ncbi:MAG: RNA-binding S4 domain-containing protein [Pseudomonadota bacterium]
MSDAGIDRQESIGPAPGLRLDSWLWYARFFKSRTQAATAVKEGRIRVDGAPAKKPADKVCPGHVLTFVRGERVIVARVVALGTRRGPAAEAQLLYEDLSPPVPPKSLFPAHAERERGSGRPTKAERRAIDRFTRDT